MSGAPGCCNARDYFLDSENEAAITRTKFCGKKKPFFSFIFLVQVLQNLKMCNKKVLIDEN
jgi:hypothetical protein